MSLPDRESPAGKPVSLFVTCIVDMIYPQTGMSVVEVLEHLGVAVDFPAAQTCCGQPGFNSGFRREAKEVARQFLRAFKDSQVIVTPSGSCAAMVRHEYPVLFAGDAEWEARALRAASITWEFSEYLVDGLGIADMGAVLPEKRTLAVHDACHGLRVLGLSRQSRALLENVGNAELAELNECDVCCGFGGLFAVKMADVSNAMLMKKIANIEASDAETIVTGDASCLTQMNGGLSRHTSAKRVRHWADVLAEGLKEKNEKKP
jgi:L-lactate dehydrogenase complex protein LldE